MDSRYEPVPVFHGRRLIGYFRTTEDQGRIQFRYDEEWRADPTTFELSVSMPKAQSEFVDARRNLARPVSHYLWGLLPDNESTLNRWARHFEIRGTNPLELLRRIGADCPGAISFSEPAMGSQMEQLSRDELNREIRRLREADAPSRLEGDVGFFSLAGAQAKTALHRTRSGWALPMGTTPSTHILKPAIPGLTEQAVNEHFCLQLARRIGIQAAESFVEYFEDVPVIVVQRYDRQAQGNGVIARIHQEDMCQALGIHSNRKYESDGGPSLSDLMRILDAHSGDIISDQERLYRAVVFNIAIAGTDAHAKNYSLIHPGAGYRPRLAPLYDLNSYYPYADQRRDVRSSMKLGGKYKNQDIGFDHLTRRIPGSRLNRDRMSGIAADLLESLPNLAQSLAYDFSAQQLGVDLPFQIASGVEQTCHRLLRSAHSAPRPRTQPMPPPKP